MYLIKPNMKYFSSIAVVVLALTLQFFLTSCNSSGGTTTLPGAWDKMGSFEGPPRSGAVSFVIGDYAYVGSGFNAQANVKLVDFWRYNATSDSWDQMADLPDAHGGRSLAVGFSMNGKGYVGTGQDINSNLLSDFYEFDPSNGPLGTWKRIADFGYSTDLGTASVSPRFSALAFSVANRGFVGGGLNNYLSALKDLWEYDATNDVWIKAPSIGGSKRANAFVMVINNGTTDIA